MRRIVLFVLAVVVVAACGGSGSVKGVAAGGGGGGGVAATEAGLQGELRDYTQQLLDKKLAAADVYDRYSTRCKGVKSFKDFSGEYLLAMGMIESVFGKGAKVTDVRVAEFTPRTAKAAAVITTAKGATAADGSDLKPFVYEGGQWRSDSCN